MISVILLAGGTGARMQASLPKQYLPLKGRPLALHSFDLLQAYGRVVVVADPAFRHFFNGVAEFALPGARRQDSVFNGLSLCREEWILIHDSARPLIGKEEVDQLIEQAKIWGAAALACPVKMTIKQADSQAQVIKTLDRASLWEIQTPQMIHRDILLGGFAKAHQDNLTVTDDVSLAELIGKPVKLVRGSYRNIKITTPEDLTYAERLLA